jgi:hypothetical protein
MKHFKSKTTEEKFKKWLNAFPESWHPNDYERFYDFVTSLSLSNDYITDSELRNAIEELKTWTDTKFINDFIDIVNTKIDELTSYFDYLNKKRIVNAT